MEEGCTLESPDIDARLFDQPVKAVLQTVPMKKELFRCERGVQICTEEDMEHALRLFVERREVERGELGPGSVGLHCKARISC